MKVPSRLLVGHVIFVTDGFNSNRHGWVQCRLAVTIRLEIC